MKSLLPTYHRNPEAATDAHWYETANAQLTADALELGVSPVTYAGIVAALSPRVAWDTPTGRTPNLDYARQFVMNGTAPTFKHNVRTAQAILDGTDPAAILGPKTRSFYFNLAWPGQSDAVTLDRHMAAALGVPQHTFRGAGYERAASHVRREAASVGLNPDAFQAAVWAQTRRETQQRCNTCTADTNYLKRELDR